MTAALDALYALHPRLVFSRHHEGTEHHSRADKAPVGDGPAHAGDQNQAALLLALDELPCYGLRSHKGAGDIDPQHLVRVFCRVLECWRFLLDASRGNEAVNPPGSLCDATDNLVERLLVPNVDTVVCQAGPQLGFSPGCHPCEFGAFLRVWQAIQRMNNRTGFQKPLGLREAKTASPAGDDDDPALEAEFWK